MQETVDRIRETGTSYENWYPIVLDENKEVRIPIDSSVRSVNASN
jgi:hypothetical protein